MSATPSEPAAQAWTPTFPLIRRIDLIWYTVEKYVCGGMFLFMALLVFGSLARGEQLVGSDQDNGIVMDDRVDEGGREYFAALGARISDLLDECGFVYCKGGSSAAQGSSP